MPQRRLLRRRPRRRANVRNIATSAMIAIAAAEIAIETAIVETAIAIEMVGATARGIRGATLVRVASIRVPKTATIQEPAASRAEARRLSANRICRLEWISHHALSKAAATKAKGPIANAVNAAGETGGGAAVAGVRAAKTP